MAETIILAGATLWPGLILSNRFGTGVSINHVQTAGQTVVQRHDFGSGNRLFLSCSLDGSALRGGYFIYSQLEYLVSVRDAGLAVQLLYRDLPEKQVMIITVPENPVKATNNPNQAPNWHYGAWYTGQIELIEV